MEVIALRAGIYEFLKRWEEMVMMAKQFVKVLPDDPDSVPVSGGFIP